MDLLANGGFPVREFVTAMFALRVDEAFRAARSGGHVKVQLGS